MRAVLACLTNLSRLRWKFSRLERLPHRCKQFRRGYIARRYIVHANRIVTEIDNSRAHVGGSKHAPRRPGVDAHLEVVARVREAKLVVGDQRATFRLIETIDDAVQENVVDAHFERELALRTGGSPGKTGCARARNTRSRKVRDRGQVLAEIVAQRNAANAGVEIVPEVIAVLEHGVDEGAELRGIDTFRKIDVREIARGFLERRLFAHARKTALAVE